MSYTKTNWQDLPNQTTPVNATNLNHIEQGIYDNDQAFLTNGLNVSNEVDEGYRVNLLHSKNLTDGIWENGGWSNTGEKTSSTSFMRTANPIYVKPNTTYTLKISKSNNQIVVYYYSASGYIDLAFVQNTDTYTFTTPANCVKINFRLSGQSLSLINTMLNEGSTAIPYEAFIQNQIVVDNEKYSDTLNVGIDSNNAGVHFEVSKNLANDTILKQGLWSGPTGITTNNSGFYVIVNCKPNTTYTISKKNTTGVLTCNATSTYPSNGVSTNGRSNVGGNGLTDIKFTTNSTDRYLFIGLITGSPTEAQKQECIQELQVEVGETKTTYEPYVSPSIKVNNKGEYETIVNKNVYSTGEVVIGEWLGKPLYRKVISKSMTPNNDNYIDTGLTNATIQNYIVKCSPDWVSNIFYNGDWLNSQNKSFYPNSDNTRMMLAATSSSSNNWYFEIILEYTKTTDV